MYVPELEQEDQIRDGKRRERFAGRRTPASAVRVEDGTSSG
jgi:hypothetical protein